MDILKTFLNMGKTVNMIQFNGKLTDEEKKQIEDTIFKYIPKELVSGNPWIVTKFWDESFEAKRASWLFGGIYKQQLKDLLTEIDNYYTEG